MRWAVVAGVLGATAIGLPGTAAADHVGISDFCLGVDHPPFAFDPPGGGNSYLTGGGLTHPAVPGASFEIVFEGPQPPPPVQVETDDRGALVMPPSAIQTFGRYLARILSDGHEVGSAALDVGPDDVPCLDPAPPAPDGGGLSFGEFAGSLLGREDLFAEGLSTGAFLGGNPQTDAAGDHFYSDPTSPPGAPRGVSDIVESAAAIADPPEPVTCDLPTTVWILECPGTMTTGSVSGGYVVTTLRLDEPVPGPETATADPDVSHLEYAVVYETNGDPNDDWQPQGPFTWDCFQGTDRWYVLRGEPATGEWTFEVTHDGHEPFESGARVAVADDLAIFLVPVDEVAGATGWRGYAFNHDGSYRPEHSAADVTGEDPTQPLEPMSTTTFGAHLIEEEATPTPSPTASEPVATSEPATEEATPFDTVAIADPPDAGSRSPLWPLVATGGLIALGGTALTRRRVSLPGGLDDAGGGLALVDGPCEDELVALDRAQGDCEAARAAAAAAREPLAAAESAEAEARAELAAARAELPRAGDRDGSSWVESEGRRLDSGDIAAADEADAAVWADYKAKRISAEEAMQRWGRRGTPEEVERLRDADVLARGLEAELASAEAATAAARSARAEAEAAADAACRKADAAAARLERCRDRARAEAEAVARAAASDAAAAAHAGTGTTVTAPSRPAPVSTTGGDDPGDEEDDQDTGCCSSGVWILYGRVTASFGFIVGRELVNYTARCVTSPGRSIEFEVLTLRVGLGAGLSGGGLAGVIWGAEHPREVYETVLKNAGGLGLDIDLGVPWAKAGKAAYQLRKSKKLLEKLKELADSAPTPKLPPSFGEGLKDAALDTLPALGGQVVKESIADLVVVPGGLGVGLAVHWGKVEESQIISMVECAECPRGGVGR